MLALKKNEDMKLYWWVSLETDNMGRGPQKAISFKRAQTPTEHWSRENRG